MKSDLTLAVVDDDLIYHRVVKRLLQTCNFEGQLIFYKNGLEAYEALSQTNSEAGLPHIILLDINMPVWDGWDFLNEYQQLKLPLEPAIYVVSSTVNPDEISRAVRYPGVRGFVEKPLDAGKISRIISETVPG